MNSMVIRRVPVEILLYLFQHSFRPQSLTSIKRKTGVCTSATQGTIQLLKRMKLLKIKKQGTKLCIELTDKGKEVARLIEVVTP